MHPPSAVSHAHLEHPWNVMTVKHALHQLPVPIRSPSSVAIHGRKHHLLVVHHVRPTVIAKMVIAASVTLPAQRLKHSSVGRPLTRLLRNAVILVLQEKMRSVRMARCVLSTLHVAISNQVTTAKNLWSMRTHSSVEVTLPMHPPDATCHVLQVLHRNAL